jgi:hypothetical protein
MVDERVDQRAGRIAGAGMDDQAGGLVDDDQFGVLVQDRERNVFGLRLGGFRLRQFDGDLLAPRKPVLGFANTPSATVTRPSRISAWTRLRDKSGASAAARNWSSRWPAASGPR